MASQEWITGSNLGEFNEESILSNVTIEYKPTTDENRVTLNPILLSSNLPSSITLSEPKNNTITVSGTLPDINEDTEYYFTLRLKEVERTNPSNVISTLDRYFVIKSLNKPVSWNEDASYHFDCTNEKVFEIDLKNYLKYANGNETFKKVSGTLPDGVSFNENGIILGYIEVDIEDITDYSFFVKAYSNGTPIEGLPDKEFIITVDPESMEQKPSWSTEPDLGNVNKNVSVGPSESKK